MTRQQETAQRWTAQAIGGQHGRTVVITGASSGIGFETAKALAARGATVVLAARNPTKTQNAVARINEATPGADVSAIPLDLTSLTSVRRAAEQISSRYPRLDLLINNAGVMMTPQGRTEDGFELQLGTNHLGHFALTGLLLGRLLAGPHSRIVTVSSFAHRQGYIDLDDLHFQQRRYRPTVAYGQSKLANLLFTHELQRRLTEINASAIAVAVEPGVVPTDLPRYASTVNRSIVKLLTAVAGQRSPQIGALSTLRAATDPGVCGGQYYAPGSLGGWRGYPVLIESSTRSHDTDVQRLLWNESQRLTGVTYPFPGLPSQQNS
ncbi:oxidoreductase [Hamadaea sp. NPDC051192]|uniref:oxidoreductase n=1 Tax=Hamadaea sp. NPDC051192 TaxID=3154940 RepID=UPI003431D8D0